MSPQDEFGRQVEVNDISPRLVTVPVGTTLHVPETHEWYLMGIAILPTRGYTPPLGADEVRNATAWGDVQICAGDARDVRFRANVLTLIDRYWGRFNLNPMLPEVAAKLTAAQQAMYTAPKMADMYALMDHLGLMYQQYLDAAAPRLDTPLTFKGGTHFTIEHVPSEGEPITTSTNFPATSLDTLELGPLQTIEVKVARALDVELSVIVKRPVS